MPELKTKVEHLAQRIQKLISLHTELKSENVKLIQLNRKLEIELKEEKQKIMRLSEGMENLQETKRITTNKNIAGIKQKINELISEVDRSVKLINTQHKK
jgi:hypothetical protein